MSLYRILNPILCLSFILSAGSLNVWANEEDEKIAAELKAKAEEEKTEAKAMEEKYSAMIPYSFNDVAENLVIIECETSMGKMVGSGFIAEMDGKVYIFTNQHVIMGADSIEFKTVTGEKLQPRGVELAKERDIARLPLAEWEEPLEIAAIIEDNGDEPIAVFGNSEGGGVATKLYGKIEEIGPELVEVSAQFVSGNSGSPVLNKQKEVIGIASFVRFNSKNDDDDEEESRRFCYRLTGEKWGSVDWRKYNEKFGNSYIEINTLVGSVFGIVHGWASDPYGYVPSDFVNYDLKKWAKEHNRMVDHINELIKIGTATTKELNSINKKISNDIYDSAQALSLFCKRKSDQVDIRLNNRDLTGFLRSEFEDNASSLEWASEKIEEFGNDLKELDYFHFE